MSIIFVIITPVKHLFTIQTFLFLFQDRYISFLSVKMLPNVNKEVMIYLSGVKPPSPRELKERRN
jgi:hypothetical protein